ncbi:hypothetical protein F4813DRAFT_134144 [Daldinia decipiens]|uniref:uncharacterized protein n=1 Tax=Daldinia decipiens TaxID=326647 RepID=UPI0020C2A0D9|nr:uncharacterized protein F4813DRAFT_134144 [Daldinia decipiens]KAI1656376.1 hypothetical protein F4813DRAFT_134144 [Daldinia decipiens]
MADARALLRAHRAENRIKHPHAAYSDAGKLLCKLCHEPVKTEALWESHIRNSNHRKRAQALQSNLPEQPQTASSADGGNAKRKHDDVDEGISDADDDAEEAIRKKRSKPDLALSMSNGGEKRQSPPELSRRTSHPPVQGVEIAIPSRPATPAAGSNSATSTPKGAPVGRSPLIGSETTSTATSTPSNLPISTQSLSVPSSTTTATVPPQAQPSNSAVDEAEWAAFEAELAAEPAPTSGPQGYSADATISAPAMTAAQIAAKSQKHFVDAQIADEREDATRALEAEFEEMEELEGRVRRLKERREQLRKGGVANLRSAAAADDDVVMAKSPADGKENNDSSMPEEDDDDEDDDEDDDWDAFRLR